MANWGRAAAGMLTLAFATSSAFVGSASAATITVKSGADLQAAIDGAMDGDTIVVKAGTYGAVSLTGRTELTIKGRGKVFVGGSSTPNCLALTSCQNIDGVGIEVRGFGANSIMGNVVVKPTQDGIDVQTELNAVTENVVTKAGQAGVSGNEITKNRITKSGTFDLRDTTGGTGITYSGNKAKTLDPSTLSNPK